GRGDRRSGGADPGPGHSAQADAAGAWGSVQLAEHAAPGAATLQGLQGRVRLVTSEESSEWDQGDHVATPPGRHRLESLEGRCRPLDRGRDTIWLRETPGNLSGPGLATHQHFAPAAANCCHSLHLIQMLRWRLTCTNGCPCWSPDEENSPRLFLTMDVLCRLS